MRKQLLSTIAGCVFVFSLFVYAATPWFLSPAVGAGGKATIKGKVTYDGKPPKMPSIKPSEAKCKAHLKGKDIPSQRLVVNDGGIQWAIVYLKDVKGSFTAPKRKVTLDQKGCMYEPHVIAVMEKQPITVRNSDPLNHNIHGLPKKNRQFNFAQPRRGLTKDVVLDNAEIFKIKCDVHSWMASYCGVFKHPFFAITDDDGSFEIKDVPPGKYTLEVWHEYLGKKSQKIEVKAGETAEADFELKKK
jgi:hypothetical protein